MYRFVNLPMLFDALVSLYADVRNKAAKRLSIPPGRTRAVPASLEPNAAPGCLIVGADRHEFPP
jgi:hypothetical protein